MTETQTPADADVIVAEYTDNIWSIALNRPTKHNALTVSMLKTLVSALADLSQRGARAVVLHGLGRSFSAGGDVRALQAMHSDDEISEYLGSYAKVGDAIAEAPFPVIAALHGVVYGGGLELACMCDFRVVDRAARLCAADIAIGLVPTGGLTWRLPRILGPGAAAWYLLTNAAIDGDAAVRAGMCEILSQDGAALEDALRVAREIPQFPAAAVSATKEALRRSEHSRLGDAADFEVATNVQRMSDPEVAALLDKAFPK